MRFTITCPQLVLLFSIALPAIDPGLAWSQIPLGSEFTYQGQLAVGGSPANGNYNLSCSLFDAAAAGNQVGSTNTFNNLAVIDGLFTVELDFDASSLNGDDRWLQFVVNGNSLSPRQPIKGAPYAVQTRGIYVNDDKSFIGIGRQNPVTNREFFGLKAGVDSGYGGMLISTNTSFGWPFYGYAPGGIADCWTYYDGATGDWHVNIDQINRLTVSIDGNVGIGTIQPLDELHVAGDNATLRLEDTIDPGGYTLIEDTQPTQLRVSKTNAAGQVLIDLNPKPANGSSNALVRFFRETDTSGIKRVQFLRGDFTTSPSASIGVDGENSYFQVHGGGVGIGTDAPSAKLHVNAFGSGEAIFGDASFLQSTGVRGRSVDGRGIHGHASAATGVNYGVYGQSNSPSGYDFYAGGAGINYGSSSSRRWKQNVESIGDPLDKIARLRGVYFNWDVEHGGHHDVGMIAEEVGKVLPEIVVFEENGVDASGMDYSKLSPLLIEAVNALRERTDDRIAQLESDCAAKNAKISELGNQIRQLQKQVEQLVSTPRDNTR